MGGRLPSAGVPMPALGGVLDPFCVSLQMAGGFHNGSADEESACNAGDEGLIPGLGRSPGGGNSNPLQYCLGNPLDRGA